MTLRLAELIALRQYETLAGEIEKEFGKRDLDLHRLQLICLRMGDGWRREPRMWLLQQLDTMECHFIPTRTDEDNDRLRYNFPTRLHTGWVFVVDSPEYLARLRNEHLSPTAKKKEELVEAPSKLARSKVFNTPEIVYPVNRVAARVAPETEPVDLNALRKLAREHPRAIAKRRQIVISAEGEEGIVVGIRQCSHPDCKGVALVTRWPDGEETLPCTAGMIYDGQETWRIPSDEPE